MLDLRLLFLVNNLKHFQIYLKVHYPIKTGSKGLVKINKNLTREICSCNIMALRICTLVSISTIIRAIFGKKGKAFLSFDDQKIKKSCLKASIVKSLDLPKI
jgi:hypothetical protein